MAPAMKTGKISTKKLVQNRENVSESMEKIKKCQVNVLSMNIPLKRRSVGCKKESGKKVLIRIGDQQISVNPEVEKFCCKFCKPSTRFKTLEILRYHLVSSHNLNTTSRHYLDPTISPIKRNTPQKLTPNKKQTPEKLPSRPQKILDSKDIQEEHVEDEKMEEGDEDEDEEEEVDASVLGKSKNLSEPRRMRGKRNNVLNSRTDKIQPTCSSQTIRDLPPGLQSPGDEDDDPSSPSPSPSPSPSEASDQNVGSDYDYYFSVSPEESLDSEDSQDLPFQKSPHSRSVTPKKDQLKSRRRQSERKFEGLKPYRCNHCELSYSSLENKKLHEQTHTEKTEVCVYCDMRFFSSRSLRRHQWIHVQPVIKVS